MKYIYEFGGDKTDGHSGLKNLLGGKGANLAEMSLIGLPVPPGFTISTEACTHYYSKGKQEVLELLQDEIKAAVRSLEKKTGKRYGDASNPLLLSVRSGARISMPGMMDTVLNLGINDEIIKGLSARPVSERMAWDSYRRFIHMYGDVVMGMKPQEQGDHDPFEEIINSIKEENGVKLDTELGIGDLQKLCTLYRNKISSRLKQEFPQDPWEQLQNAITAVFDSWMGKRAIQYRKINGIPSDWGTAVNVQAMVFGNISDASATGVAFTRDPATGEKQFTGEYLVNAQGEDVVAGIRTPMQITTVGSRRWASLAGVSEDERKNEYPSLEEKMPEMYRQLFDAQRQLELHYRDMQDLEFTVENQKLWILQTRSGKRTGNAMVNISIDMLEEGLISEEEVVMRNDAAKLDELLHPVFDEKSLAVARVLTKGLPASPGAASGQVVFFAEDAEDWANAGKQVILVRIETSPEDIQGMHTASGILTSRGGMTSHAAVVARGMGKCCISGAGSLQIDYKQKSMQIDGEIIREGDWISLDGTSGKVYADRIPTVSVQMGGAFEKLMEIADRKAKLRVLANADTPADASTARKFGAQGIGLCRTEHMFFQEERIDLVREMILSHDESGRVAALEKLLPIQRKDFEEILESMQGLPVTIRLLDPPLHEFLPQDEENEKALADKMGITYEEVLDKVNTLHEMNPMLGHRGCRLANTYPEISIMQTRAIIEAAIKLNKQGIDVQPEIMIPLAGISREVIMQIEVIKETAEHVFQELNTRVDYKIGTMIEIPRAALVADRFADHVDFFSFGTNDLTQMTYGYSRDDFGKFLPVYLSKGILRADPFTTIDQFGVGELVEIGTKRGRSKHPELKVGVCGEHGGDPESIKFFHRTGLDYVSCSPYRIPIARLVAGQAAIENVPHERLHEKGLE
ncbi:MAG: pyruvate, phosphate dikinase, partial [Saprospiraceae bacterium]|nr:pyruvate, phosphate dikinase [Saprospiraceae bacterium]